MNQLDKHYVRILSTALLQMRHAAERGDVDYCLAEAEHVHNVPSLLGEQNLRRHAYYYRAERMAFLRWIEATGREDVLSWVKMHYEGAWDGIARILRSAPGSEDLDLGSGVVP